MDNSAKFEKRDFVSGLFLSAGEFYEAIPLTSRRTDSRANFAAKAKRFFRMDLRRGHGLLR